MIYGDNISNKIIEAISKTKRLRIFYNGGFRIVEPHAYGQGSKGHDLLRLFQIDGYSKSGVPFGWKLTIASGHQSLSGVTVLNDNFEGPREGFRRGDSAMTRIYAEL